MGEGVGISVALVGKCGRVVSSVVVVGGLPLSGEMCLIVLQVCNSWEYERVSLWVGRCM